MGRVRQLEPISQEVDYLGGGARTSKIGPNLFPEIPLPLGQHLIATPPPRLGPSEPSEHPGYVQVSSRDPRYFAFTNGDS